MHHKTHDGSSKYIQLWSTYVYSSLEHLGTISELSFVQPWHHGGQAGQTGQAGHLGATAKSKSNAPLPRPLPRSPQPFEKECSGHFSQRISGQSFPQVRLREIGFKRVAKQLCRFCFSYEFHQSLDLLPSHHNYLMIVTIRSHDRARCGREISRSSRCL